ncbi:hypothetical protein [Nocardioides panzhihuensis]|uniref:PPE domain-containing protein n=1 Tax=Nocardioides panzhihuensis TaxID=860243 RepID=A0A7Z0IU57_9ACTN|nr:hypothetical protein [Nocardioides panzhihuensis]NYI79879.1 hypothetical protein [Nocardioides panzhihuensis]
MSVIKGGMMETLKQYVATAKPDDVEARLDDWNQAGRALRRVSQDLEAAADNLPKAFEETSLTTNAAQQRFRDSAQKLAHKAVQLEAAVKALSAAQTTTRTAMEKHARLEASLPTNHGPAPDPSSPKYAQSGTGVDTVQAVQNQKALQADRAAHAAREQAIADAEAAAAQQIQVVDEDNYTAEPPVRAITDEPNSDPGSAPAAPSSPGSYSEIAAARARMASYNSGTLYPGGMGHELIAQEKAIIAAHEAENKPEWNGTQWVNADGSPAPSTSYAMVETADGLAPLGGGAGGMAALAIAGGGALLGAGAAKALASRFAAGSAKAATASATSKSATARSGSAAARAGAAGARAGAGAGAGARGAGAGAGARGGAAGGRGAGARGGATGAGSRGGRGGSGGAGGRGGKKDDKRGSQDQDWQADYTDDWTETASDVLDPNASRGWTPNAPADDDKDRRKP